MSHENRSEAPGRSVPNPPVGEPSDSSAAVIEHIQGATERQKALLARELHDELGGLLVGAVMDVAWAEQHLSAPAAEVKQKLLRARQTLSTAIDLKRRIIEDLRPTLLDNVGLFAALRWHVQATCKHADLVCTIELPEEERRFLPNVPITLFRIVQEAFALIVLRQPAGSAEFSVAISPESLSLRMSRADQHTPASEAPSAADAHSLSALQYRTSTLNGKFSHTVTPTGISRIAATFPLAKLVA